MKLRIFGVVACMAVLLVAGCKSKETTSAILHNDTGRYDLAIETASEAIEKDPNDAEAHFQLGIAYSRLDSVELAYSHFMTAADLEADNQKRQDMVENNIQSNFARHYNLALKMLQDQDYANARTEFQLSTESDPRQAKGFYQLGQVDARLGDETGDIAKYEEAIVSLDKVLELSTPADKFYIDALSLAGETLAKSGKPEEAISRFNRLVEEDPTNYRVIENIGYDRLNNQDWKGAVVFLDLAQQARSKIGAENFDLYYNIGVANFQMGKDDPEALAKAVASYQKALEMQPNEPQTTYNIVVAHVVGKQWAEAVSWGERYVAQNPDEANGWRVLSRAYNEMGDQEKARQCMARYEELKSMEGGSK